MDEAQIKEKKKTIRMGNKYKEIKKTMGIEETSCSIQVGEQEAEQDKEEKVEKPNPFVK